MMLSPFSHFSLVVRELCREGTHETVVVRDGTIRKVMGGGGGGGVAKYKKNIRAREN